MMKAYQVVVFGALIVAQAFGAASPTFSWIKKNIFQTRCATTCHQATNSDGNVDLTSYQGLMTSEGMLEKPVVPGAPEQSGIWIQTHQKTMPKSGETLTDEEIQAVFDWIKDGAKEN